MICESGNRYKQKVEAQFHLTMAALDPKSQKGNKSASVYVENLGTEYLVCNLNGEKKLQERLDLMFGESEEITFFVKGEGTVHLTGYEMPEEADIGFGDEEFSDEEEALPIANGKRKPEAQAASPLKKLKAAEPKAQNVIDIDTSKLEKKPDNKKQQPAKQQQNAKPQAQQKKPAVAPEDDDDELDGIDSDIDSEELDKMINQESDDEMDEDDEFDDDDDEEDDLEDDDDSEDGLFKSFQLIYLNLCLLPY